MQLMAAFYCIVENAVLFLFRREINRISFLFPSPLFSGSDRLRTGPENQPDTQKPGDGPAFRGATGRTDCQSKLGDIGPR